MLNYPPTVLAELAFALRTAMSFCLGWNCQKFEIGPSQALHLVGVQLLSWRLIEEITNVTCALAHTTRQQSMQSSRAREQRKGEGQPRRGGEQGREGRGPSRATKQGSRAQGGRRNSTCKRPQTGEHWARNILTFSRVCEPWQERKFANGRGGANICQEIC